MRIKFRSENLKARDLLGDRRRWGYVLKKDGGRMEIGFMWLRIGTTDRFLEHGNEPSVA
jgi:hypothetical protein